MKGLLAGFVLLAAAGPLSGAPGYRMDLAGKAPLLVPSLEAGDGKDWLSPREPLLYLGGSLTFRPVSRSAELELNGARVTLLLGEPWAYQPPRRLALQSGPRWRDGRVLLTREDLESLLKSLEPAAPALITATAEALAAARTPVAPVLDPTLVPAPEPQIVKTSVATRGVQAPGRKIGRICIDPGHGGYDPGARGPKGSREKETCLDIAKRLKTILDKKYPDVFLTRDRDEFVSLRKRTVDANERDADLFISIHNNASLSRRSRGSQVFFYDSRSSDRAAEDLARRENEDANYLEFIMTDLAKSLVRDQSIQLAQGVQDELAELGSDLGVSNRRLSYAPFYVLARTKMPAILVEVAFISNPREEKLLQTPYFRDKVARAIAQGVDKYRVELAKQ